MTFATAFLLQFQGHCAFAPFQGLLDGAGWQRKSDPESLKPFHVQRLLLPFLKGQGEDEITHSLDD